MGLPSQTSLLAGRYELQSVLGRGGMGEVWHGQDVRLSREVAVKLLRTDLAAQLDVRQRFEGEARLAAQLSHPNAVTVHDSGEHDGQPYIVMEYVPGPTLADVIGRGPLPADYARRVASQVLGALQAAHDRGIVHRDVKPANVLLAADGSAKVADFGIAKTLEGTQLTATGTIVGTASYLAPEQLAGGSGTVRSDLYAVGVLLYEMLAGVPPYGGDTPVAVAYAIQAGSARPIAEARHDLEPHLIATVERAMHRDPDRRFPTALAMATSLGASGAHAAADPAATTITVSPEPTRAMPVGAHAPAPPAQAWTSQPRTLPRRWPLLAVGLLALLVVLVVLLAGDDGGSSPRPPSSSSTSTSLPQPLDDALDRLEEVTSP